ncbi:MAG: hypothetical protein ACOC7R_01995, partial [Planctomycetota bacterium]
AEPVDAAPAEASQPTTDDDSDGGPINQADLDALFEQAEAIRGRSDTPETTPATETNTPVSQADVDALFDPSSPGAKTPRTPAATNGEQAPRENLEAIFAEAERHQQAAAAEAGAATTESVNQAELDALFAQAAAETPAETTDDEGPVTQEDLDALFARATGSAPPAGAAEPTADPPPETTAGETGTPTAEEPPEPMAEAPAEATPSESDGTINQADLDALFAQAAGETPAETTDDDLEAALERQQVEHPDADDSPAAAEPVSAAETDSLRRDVASDAPADAPPPIARLDELDALLADRAEQGAAVADLASDPVGADNDHLAADLPDEAADLGADAPPAAPAATAPDAVQAPAAAPTAAAEETIAPPSPASTEREPEPAPAPAASSETAPAPARPRGDWRARGVALLEAINRPFAYLSPSLRDILGYAGVALLGAAFFLVLLTLMR